MSPIGDRDQRVRVGTLMEDSRDVASELIHMIDVALEI